MRATLLGSFDHESAQQRRPSLTKPCWSNVLRAAVGESRRSGASRLTPRPRLPTPNRSSVKIGTPSFSAFAYLTPRCRRRSEVGLLGHRPRDPRTKLLQALGQVVAAPRGERAGDDHGLTRERSWSASTSSAIRTPAAAHFSTIRACQSTANHSCRAPAIVGPTPDRGELFLRGGPDGIHGTQLTSQRLGRCRADMTDRQGPPAHATTAGTWPVPVVRAALGRSRSARHPNG